MSRIVAADALDRIFSGCLTGRACIVIAWIEDGRRCTNFETRRTDLGEAAVFEDVLIPRAALWLNSGDEEDWEKASKHASTFPRSKVFAFPTDEPDPQGRARREILENPPA